MHFIIILAVIVVLFCIMPRLMVGIVILGGMIVFYGVCYSFLANPRGNLSPELIEKFGLDKPAEAKAAPEPTANGPVAIKPLPVRRTH